MSTEKNMIEALRWLKTGEDDLDVARVLKINGKFPHACFHSQQAAEKALKAVWYFKDEDPWGHSVRRLIEEIENFDEALFETLKGLLRAGTILDRFYVPTRYPNGLPDLTPGEAYLEEDAATCIGLATEVVTAIKGILPERTR